MASEKAKAPGYIKYVGASHVRGLTEEDFETVGVRGQKAVWWRRENQWTVPRADLSDDAYNRAIKNDPELILVGGNGDESLSEEQAEGRAGLAVGMTPMPPGPEKPGDYVGGGSISGGSSAGGTSSGATGGSASGSTASK